MQYVHRRLAELKARGKAPPASETLENAWGMAVGNIPFTLVPHEGRRLLVIDIEGESEPLSLALTRSREAELRPFPPLAESTAQYDFSYHLSYEEDGKPPYMAIRALQEDGSTVFIVFTDDPNKPMQTVVQSSDAPVPDQVWFQITIDQFNDATLRDFVQNTEQGRVFCAAKDYSFTSIFENAQEIGQRVCRASSDHSRAAPSSSLAAKPTQEKKTSVYTNVKRTETPVASRSSASASNAAPGGNKTTEKTTEKTSKRKQKKLAKAESTASAPDATQSKNAKTSSTTKSFSSQYWYIYVIGAVALIIGVTAGVIMYKKNKNKKGTGGKNKNNKKSSANTLVNGDVGSNLEHSSGMKLQPVFGDMDIVEGSDIVSM